MEVSVYLIAGFLGSGKTSLIPGLLEKGYIPAEGKTLLLQCEAGEEKLSEEILQRYQLVPRRLKKEKELYADTLEELRIETGCQQVIIEYNGMWSSLRLYRALPLEWVIQEKFVALDVTTLHQYNANMPEQMKEHFRSAGCVLLNRLPKLVNLQKVYDIIREATKRADIAVVDEDGNWEPLKWDPVPLFGRYETYFQITKDEFPRWVKDMEQNPNEYAGKTVRVVGQVMYHPEVENMILIGWNVMTYSIRVQEFTCLPCMFGEKIPVNRGWIDLTAKIAVRDGQPQLEVEKYYAITPPADTYEVFV